MLTEVNEDVFGEYIDYLVSEDKFLKVGIDRSYQKM